MDGAVPVLMNKFTAKRRVFVLRYIFPNLTRLYTKCLLQDCPRRWRGCSCKRGGACGTWSCECYKWSRECDVDLCVSCHAAEILDPVNLAKERNGEIYEGGCANVSIQRGETKRTLMGRSAIAGWGLFAGEKVKAGQFLGVIFLYHIFTELTSRNIREKLLGMRRANDEGYCMIKRVFHFCLP